VIISGAGKAMQSDWVVMKFGGTSVAGRPQWQETARLVRGRQAEGFRVLLVRSAVAGVTNRLAAHEALIPGHAGGVFGSSWQEIRGNTSAEQGTAQ